MFQFLIQWCHRLRRRATPFIVKCEMLGEWLGERVLHECNGAKWCFLPFKQSKLCRNQSRNHVKRINCNFYKSIVIKLQLWRKRLSKIVFFIFVLDNFLWETFALCRDFCRALFCTFKHLPTIFTNVFYQFFFLPIMLNYPFWYPSSIP